jgi:hypothetical protein
VAKLLFSSALHSTKSCPGTDAVPQKASASFEYGPMAFWKMFFRFMDYPVLCFNLGFEISDICRKAVQWRSAHTPAAIFALERPNRNVWIYVAHEPSMRSLGHGASGAVGTNLSTDL